MALVKASARGPQESPLVPLPVVEETDGVLEPLYRFGKIINPQTVSKRMTKFCDQVVDFCKKPSWTHLSEKIGCHNVQKRPLRLSPSYQDCKDHGIVTTQKWMGASCLVFYLPGMVYLWQLCVVGSTVTLTTKLVGGAVSVFLAYVSTVAFLADYWYTGDDEFRENSTIPECQKQWIFNAIDLANVPLIAVTMVTLGAVQGIYGNAYRWVMPLVFLLFSMGVYTQQVSLKYLESYTEHAYAEGYDRTNVLSEATTNITWGLYLHILWHILAAIAPISQMYVLLRFGISKPSWVSYCF